MPHIPTPVFALDAVINSEDPPILPRDLCTYMSRREYTTTADDIFEGGFHLVVGDSLSELIYFWNRGILRKPFQGRDTFWLSKELSRDDNVLLSIAQWIERYSYCDQQRTNKIITQSIDVRSLKKLHQRMQQLSGRKFDLHKLSPKSFPISETEPRPPHTGEVPSVVRVGPIQRIMGETIAVPAPGTGTSGSTPVGTWMVDIEIKTPEWGMNRIHYSETWKPPRRVGASSLFFWPPSNPSRVTASGLLSVPAWSSHRNIAIRFPSIHRLYSVALQEWQLAVSGDVRLQSISPNFIHLQDSSGGVALEKMLGVFGGLENAVATLGDGGWLNVITTMLGKDLRQQILGLLENHSTEPAEMIAESIVEKLVRYKASSLFVSRKELKRLWSAGKPRVLQGQVRDTVYNERFDDLLKRKVLLQGAEITCPECSVSNWTVVDELASDMRCPGCLTAFSVPQIEMSLKLNGLVFEALRLQGILGVVETLDILRSSSRESFLFLPSQNIIKTNAPEQSFTDLDVAVIKDGRYILGEVKSSSVGIQQMSIVKMSEIVESLRPDVFVLAAPSNAFDAVAERTVRKLQRELRKHHTEFLKIPLLWSIHS